MHVLSIALLEIHGCKRDHARRVRLRTPMRERLMGEPVEGISGPIKQKYQNRNSVSMKRLNLRQLYKYSLPFCHGEIRLFRAEADRGRQRA